MEADNFQAIINISGALLGALIGGGISAWIAKQQLSLSIKQQKLEILKNEYELLQNIAKEFTNLKANVSDIDLTPTQIQNKLVDLFVEKSTVFLSYSYEFESSLEKEVNETCNNVNTLIYKSKIGEHLDPVKTKAVLESLHLIEKKMEQAIKTRIRLIKNDLDHEKNSIK